jgi:hypothetical protein
VFPDVARGLPPGRHHGAREAGRDIRPDGRERGRRGHIRRVQGRYAEGQLPPGRRPLLPAPGAIDHGSNFLF